MHYNKSTLYKPSSFTITRDTIGNKNKKEYGGMVGLRRKQPEIKVS